MIKLDVEVDDWDTGQMKKITLPCNLKMSVDTEHDLQLIDWEADISIERTDDIEKINTILDDINMENPTMTMEIFEAILKASDSFLDDDGFVKKMCNGDFMLEKVEWSNSNLLRTDEEKCAYFLAVKMLIPFAKNITESILDDMARTVGRVDWKAVWKHYYHMGFETIKINKVLYAFHWGDAEPEM